ncbi:exodeoxyribonuclease VII small subunit [Allofournierella massiliensis]|uniref:Exodeoxyribonuclease VII small subunit n=1 Tax=Allofournierella massiliensis TaxID=1650663 RepID=A0A4R1R0D4_9FIRM|nr:exodeoxyribonuclease VII small subunit [Fournierella massiliensis]TCL58754.1 exodeoxyribonuclease VII small subunit [Fournierella massiliensis]
MRKPKSFEEGSAALQQVLDQLADPATPLDKAIKLYSDAASLIAYCSETLEQARLEMERIDLTLSQRSSVAEAGEEDILA